MVMLRINLKFGDNEGKTTMVMMRKKLKNWKQGRKKKDGHVEKNKLEKLKDEEGKTQIDRPARARAQKLSV